MDAVAPVSTNNEYTLSLVTQLLVYYSQLINHHIFLLFVKHTTESNMTRWTGVVRLNEYTLAKRRSFCWKLSWHFWHMLKALRYLAWCEITATGMQVLKRKKYSAEQGLFRGIFHLKLAVSILTLAARNMFFSIFPLYFSLTLVTELHCTYR